jgi:hypothetical protein
MVACIRQSWQDPGSSCGTYPYYICIGRQRDKTSCTQRSIRIEEAEEAIAAHCATVQLPEEEVKRLRTFLGGELTKLRTDADHERTTQERRLRKIVDERQKLLDAHYADAIPLDLLKSEQTRIATEVAADFQKAETNLQRALTRAGDCEAAYREAKPTIRRQFNLAFFKRLLIDEDCTVTASWRSPSTCCSARSYGKQPSPKQATSCKTPLTRPSDGRPPRTKATNSGSSTPPSFRGGFSPNTMVRPSGLEPPRTIQSTRPSTLRVYQFRHGRMRGAEYSLRPHGVLVLTPAATRRRHPCRHRRVCIHPRRALVYEHMFVARPHPLEPGAHWKWI